MEQSTDIELTQTPQNIFESETGRTSRTEVSISKRRYTKIGLHGAKMIMTSDPQRNEAMLSQVGVPDNDGTPIPIESRIYLAKQLVAKSLGINLDSLDEEVPNRIGFNLTSDPQRKILFGVFDLMTETDYRGDYQIPRSMALKKEIATEKEALTKGYDITSTGTHIGGVYENIPSIPVIRVTQKELLEKSGFNLETERQRGVQALTELAFRQNFILYRRFAKDEKGRLRKDKSGRQIHELVGTFSPVLNVNFVKEESTSGGDEATTKYYEISLAPVFLDEVSREFGSRGRGYFLLIPKDCNDEINRAYKKVFPSRTRRSSVIQALCLWLRLKVLDIQNRNSNPFTKSERESQIITKYSDLCSQLNIPSNNYKNNYKKMRETLSDGMEIAKEIGYILPTSREERGIYTFDINFDYYPYGREKKKDSEDEAK